MNAIAFSVRKDESLAFEKVSKDYNINIKFCNYHLDENNVDEVQGYDTVIFSAKDDINDKVLKKIKDFGIKFIGTRSAGVDNIDIDTAKRLGIKVSNVPSYSPNSVSEFTILSLLSLLRNYHTYIKRINAHDFRIQGLIAKELRNQVIGIVGAGRIGSLTIKHIYGFSPKEILVYSKMLNDETKKYAKVAELDELYSKSDVIIYHIPLTEETKNMICKESINKMKKGVIIINVSRGGIMNAKDFLESLKEGHIGGAALDVYENENVYLGKNLSESFIEDSVIRDILSFPNVILTPHIAFYTDEAVANMISISISNAKELYETGECKNIVDNIL